MRISDWSSDVCSSDLGAITLALIPLAVTATLLRRGSAVGQSPLIYGLFAAMVVLWWGVTAGFYGGSFREWQYILTGVMAFTLLVAVAIAVSRMRAALPSSQPAVERANA